MDGKGREGTYNFFHDDSGAAGGSRQGIGHRGQLPPATPLAPPMVLRWNDTGQPNVPPKPRTSVGPTAQSTQAGEIQPLQCV